MLFRSGECDTIWVDLYFHFPFGLQLQLNFQQIDQLHGPLGRELLNVAANAVQNNQLARVVNNLFGPPFLKQLDQSIEVLVNAHFRIPLHQIVGADIGDHSHDICT